MGGWFIHYKNKPALSVIEILLQEMNYRKCFGANYGSRHIISQIRQMNKNKEFEHQVVEGLVHKFN